MFSKGSFVSSLESNSDSFTGFTNIDDISIGCDTIGDVVKIDDTDDEDNDVTDVEDIDGADDEDISALGRKTMTVLPTVVTNSSNPKTVLVVTPENCEHNNKQLCNDVKHVRYIGHLAFIIPSFTDEDGLVSDFVEEVEDTTDGTENDHLNNSTL